MCPFSPRSSIHSCLLNPSETMGSIIWLFCQYFLVLPCFLVLPLYIPTKPPILEDYIWLPSPLIHLGLPSTTGKIKTIGGTTLQASPPQPSKSMSLEPRFQWVEEELKVYSKGREFSSLHHVQGSLGQGERKGWYEKGFSPKQPRV